VASGLEVSTSTSPLTLALARWLPRPLRVYVLSSSNISDLSVTGWLAVGGIWWVGVIFTCINRGRLLGARAEDNIATILEHTMDSYNVQTSKIIVYTREYNRRGLQCARLV